MYANVDFKESGKSIFMPVAFSALAKCFSAVAYPDQVVAASEKFALDLNVSTNSGDNPNPLKDAFEKPPSPEYLATAVGVGRQTSPDNCV